MVLQLTKVLSNRALNEVSSGYASYLFGEDNLTTWTKHWMSNGGPFGPITSGSPRITFTNFTSAGNNAAPRYRVQNLYSIKDNFTFSYDAHGRHDLKTGGEFLLEQIYTSNCTQCMGIIDARDGPAPANLESILPDPFNVDYVEPRGYLVAHAPLHAGRAQEPARAGTGVGLRRVSCRTTGTFAQRADDQPRACATT